MRKPKFAWRIAALQNGFRDATAYRAEFLSEIVGSALVPAAIQWVLWYAMFQLGGASEIAGMTYTQMIHYTLVSILFTQVRGGDHDFELMELIRTGQLSNYLLRPVGVIEFIFIRGFAPRLLIAGICLLLGAGIGAAVGFSPLRMFPAMLLALLGCLIHFQIGAVLSTAAFLWEDAYSILMVKNLTVSLLSGELMPLNLFPPSVEWLWKSTPFYLYVYGPTQYALGNWTHQQFLESFAIAIAWSLGLWVLIRLSWGLGIRKYSSLGG